MPLWLTVIIATLPSLVIIGGIIVALYKFAHKINIIVDRPYPCAEVTKLKQEMKEKHAKYDGYFSKDKAIIEEHTTMLAILIESKKQQEGINSRIDLKLDKIYDVVLSQNKKED